MKHRTTRFLSVLISVLMLVSLLPAAALANDNAIRIYTSPDGLEAGAYYFDMDSGDLYALLEGRRYNEKLIESGSSQEDAEAYAEAQAPLDLAAFRQAAWSIDPDSLMLDAVFPQGYDPSAVFSLEDSSDWAFMLRLLRLAGEDALEWGDVAVPERPDDLMQYAHRQYFIDLPRAYVVYYNQAYEAASANPGAYESEYDMEQSCADFALYVLGQLQKAEYGVRPDDPLFRVKMTWTEGGVEHLLYYPYEALANGTGDDVSQFVKERHDYLDECDWTWTDPEHVTVTFYCYLGRVDGEDDSISYEVPAESIEMIDYVAPTELRDGYATYRASVVYYDSVYSDSKILTSDHTFVIEATGDPHRLHITKQPEDAELTYPQGVRLSVEVDDPDFIASCQWYDTDARGQPVKLDGLTASTLTLVLPSTMAHGNYYDLFCEIIDLNGNKVVSDTARVEVVNSSEHKPVFYVGDHAIQPGETLDLSETVMGTGLVTFDANGHEVTLDNISVDIDSDHLLFDTVNSPCLGVFAAGSGCMFEDDEFYIHVVGDCVVNSNYYDQEHYSAGVALSSHFRASDVDTDTKLIIDGDGTLFLNGGGTAVNTDSDLDVNTDLRTCNNGQYYGSGLYVNGNLSIGDGVNVDIRSFGPGFFVDYNQDNEGVYYHDIHIGDGAKVTIDATAGHVWSLNTTLYGIAVNGNLFAKDAEIDIRLHAITDTMLPYGGIVDSMTGITAFNIVFEGTDLSMTIDAESAEDQYVNKVFGISGDSLQRLYLLDGAAADIRIGADMVSKLAEGIQSGWEWNDDEGLGIYVEAGSELDIDVRTTGSPVVGIDFTNPVYVTDSILKVNAESLDGGMVFGILAPGTEFDLNGSGDSVSIRAKDGIAVFANDDKDETEYDPDYVPELIRLSGNAKIVTPLNGVISRYGFPYSGSLVPGETVYESGKQGIPAQRVVIRARQSGGSAPQEPVPSRPALPFDDVAPGDWYYNAVAYVFENGLMNGVADRIFDPDGTTTRAMLVTILHRLEGRPESSGEHVFDDVSPDVWYGTAVQWAASNGIVAGYGDGRFGPEDPLTREQFAVIMYRYAGFKGYDTGKTADLSGYSDASSISVWAEAAMKWANAEGMITGREAAMLVPQGITTRAEAAKIISLSPVVK